jgi:mediator of RNA polymerase II transcription subunit 22
VSELKRTYIFFELASLNGNVERRIEVLGQQAEGTKRMLERIGQEAAAPQGARGTLLLICCAVTIL